MNAKQKIHQAKLDQWIGLFKEQADSGLSVRQWCEKNNPRYSIWITSAVTAQLKNAKNIVSSSSSPRLTLSLHG